jgi:hypothetical protein
MLLAAHSIGLAAVWRLGQRSATRTPPPSSDSARRQSSSVLSTSGRRTRRTPLSYALPAQTCRPSSVGMVGMTNTCAHD